MCPNCIINFLGKLIVKYEAISFILLISTLLAYTIMYLCRKKEKKRNAVCYKKLVLCTQSFIDLIKNLHLFIYDESVAMQTLKNTLRQFLFNVYK